MANRVMVGMSGGVDSSVAALLLRDQGWDVAGATFLLWDWGDGDGSGGDAVDAKAVCDRLGIPHFVLDFREVFQAYVVESFATQYQTGQTPNPCVACNRHIKFGAFLAEARALGYGHIATGHYAAVEQDAALGRFHLRRGRDEKKDQSYVLYHLTQEQLAAVVFPLGGMTKEEVRAVARERGLAAVNRAESQDICFIPGGDYAAFLENRGVEFRPGSFVDQTGRALGAHRGVGRYTVGQRKGLGIALGRPVFVKSIDPEANTVTLAEDGELWTNELTACDARWIELPRDLPLAIETKIRYAHKAQPAQVEFLPDGRVRVLFDSPVRAVTPGQAVVFYSGDYVLGGATIQLEAGHSQLEAGHSTRGSQV